MYELSRMFEWKSAKNHFRVLRMELVVRRSWGQWFEFYLLAVVPFLLLAVEKFFLLLAYATEGVGNLFARRFSIEDCPASLLVPELSILFDDVVIDIFNHF